MVEQRGLATLPVGSGGTPARENNSKLGNAVSPVRDSGYGGDVEVEDVETELWAGWLGRRRGGTAGKARRNAAELAVDGGGRNVEHWRGEWRVRGVHSMRAVLWTTSGLTGGVNDGVRPIGGRTRGGG